MCRFIPLAALLAAAGVAPAQGQPPQVVQVEVQVAGDIVLPDVPAGKPLAKPEFKPAADANPDPKSLAVPEELAAKAKALVKQLGSASYRERENASREIGKLGRAAYGPLKAAAEELNPEIRLRADILMPGIEAQEMEARVACFMKDLEGKFEHDLPGWHKFRAAAGNDPGTRALFADVLRNKTYHALLIAAELPAHELGGMLNNHFRDMQQAQNNGMILNRRGGYGGGQPTAAELAVLIFLEGLHTDKDLGMNYNFGYTVSNYMHTTDVQNAMTNGRGTGKYGAPFKKLVLQWLETRETANGAQMAMNLAQNWNLPNRMKYAAKVLAAPTENGNWWIKQQALLTIGQANNKEAREYLPQIAKCFDDSTVIQQSVPGNGTQPTVLMRDFALGVALQMTGQKVKDYGMDAISTGVNWNHNNFYFKDDKAAKADDKRKAAFKKWDEWAAASKKDPMKDEPKKDDEPKK